MRFPSAESTLSLSETILRQILPAEEKLIVLNPKDQERSTTDSLINQLMKSTTYVLNMAHSWLFGEKTEGLFIFRKKLLS